MHTTRYTLAPYPYILAKKLAAQGVVSQTCLKAVSKFEFESP